MPVIRMNDSKGTDYATLDRDKILVLYELQNLCMQANS